LSLRTDDRLQIVDLTPRITARVRSSPVQDGIALVMSMHTTLALFVNETQGALLDDIQTFLTELVPRDRRWKHDDPLLSDCDRQNADAHVKASMLGHSLAIPIQDGELVLGTFQAVLAAELDGPRQRSLHLQLIGS
jgi:secondary thiamine-phosphate synthase enzyme